MPRGRTRLHVAGLVPVICLHACTHARSRDTSEGRRLEPSLRIHPAPARTDAVVPIAYDVELEIDPGSDEFVGRVAIDLDVRRPVGDLRIDALALDVTWWSLAQRAERIDAILTADAATEALVIRPGGGLAAGPARLEIGYRGRFGDAVGAFRPPGAAWSVFTQFEPTEARRVIPCFDRPRFKVPWTIRLVVPANSQAFSNAPVEREEAAPGGRKRVRFAATPPLPSYLIAFAVGELRVTELPGGPVPMRLIETGRGDEDARRSARAAPDILRRIEERLARKTPYPKVDIAVVPGLRYGGMENPGLITVRDVNESVLAHELVHLWFGDLVTPASWRDLWLAEGLTIWLAEDLVNLLPTSGTLERLWQIAADSLPDADAALLERVDDRTVRMLWEAVANETSTASVFSRAPMVLSMIDRWIGRPALLRGVRSYLDHHAHSVASTEDFAWHLARASRPEAADMVTSFLARRGVPEVAFQLDCSGRRPRLHLTQTRFRPLGSPPAPGDRGGWTIPVCVRHPRGRDCTLLSEPRGSMPLPLRSCPAWVHPNADGAGYYRSRISPDALAVLLAAADDQILGRDEAAELAATIGAMVETGALEVDSGLTALARLAAAAEHFEVLAAAVLAVQSVRAFAPADLEPAFREFLRRHFSAFPDVEGFARNGSPRSCAAGRPAVCRALAARHGRRLRTALAPYAAAPTGQ